MHCTAGYDIKADQIHFFPKLDQLEDRENRMLEDGNAHVERLHDFIDSVPRINVIPTQVNDLRVDNYEKQVSDLENKLSEVSKANEKLVKDQAKMQEELSKANSDLAEARRLREGIPHPFWQFSGALLGATVGVVVDKMGHCSKCHKHR